MSGPFEDFYDEIENLDSAVSKFIHPREFGERWDGTWAYFSFSYERAFEQLARKAYEDGQGYATHSTSILARSPFNRVGPIMAAETGRSATEKTTTRMSDRTSLPGEAFRSSTAWGGHRCNGTNCGASILLDRFVCLVISVRQNLGTVVRRFLVATFRADSRHGNPPGIVRSA
jgi:hypothetical protein